MYRLLLLPLPLALLLGACVSVQQRVEVTPGTVSPQIVGAKWPQTPVAYCIVRDDEGGYVDYDTFVALTQRAMAAWGVPTTFAGECDGSMRLGDGQNEIGWGDLGGDPGNLTEAGRTDLRYRSGILGSPPDIIEADITIERVPAQGKATQQCLYTAILHETGHLFGLTHSSAGTIMAPVISDCLQAPTPADLAALNKLY